ncbi:hypothetical protein SELMODRAFT_272183 [Selaginella moellendorffii]|uniref:Uncharacterized protein n=2 Tax=Selaginella moellendorffii TaxID=88036 RepID=D8T687_SELML|nr:anaphase-promoting complex subunit 6 [Selaginella moellendorffii]XP_002991677.1 anaphase-promoting complex subunit 6 isoform X2 [Selaginella moellendorffii]EFJ07248.1 hypothetical protein SELMODRAFT_272222 [Selaginella moellendorffii]EFJ07871.1 hypothetical protein SELMODRAFT_272183 [Selaginella moellendorffii]|eukprot:XP_002991063.1 anaphase-promoting complex subunit 6 [Selaginella moellendorffii]
MENKLRAMVRDCLDKHLHASAIFLADKLVTVGGTEEDVHLHAQALFQGRQFRRALHLLRTHGLLHLHPRYRYLAAKCLEEIKEWDECLSVLGDYEVDQHGNYPMKDDIDPESGHQAGINIAAALCLLRGRACEALENRTRALCWYKASLRVDPYCYEAYEHIVDNHMLSSEKEVAFLSSLKFDADDRWLSLLYSCQAKKYGQISALESKLSELEREPQKHSNVGLSLKDNNDVLACRADYLYHRGEFQLCYDITKTLLEKDPYHLKCMPLHLGAALELGRKNELFLRAHNLVQEYSQRPIAWFAVGCYYYCIRQFDHARRYFCKATTLDGAFYPAWLGFGNAYAAQDESDQAMAAYRTAARLFSGCHMPALCIGMEYLRTNNLNLAEQFFMQAKGICPTDPLVYNELGVMAYRNREYEEAARWLRKALVLVQETRNSLTLCWEPTVVNLAHTLRKLKLYPEAISMYEKALALCPRGATTYAALGFTHHLQGSTGIAIDFYHKALGLKPDDTFTAEMLTAALTEECLRPSFAKELTALH